jgi:hypothetical protein
MVAWASIDLLEPTYDSKPDRGTAITFISPNTFLSFISHFSIPILHVLIPISSSFVCFAQATLLYRLQDLRLDASVPEMLGTNLCSVMSYQTLGTLSAYKSRLLVVCYCIITVASGRSVMITNLFLCLQVHSYIKHHYYPYIDSPSRYSVLTSVHMPFASEMSSSPGCDL